VSGWTLVGQAPLLDLATSALLRRIAGGKVGQMGVMVVRERRLLVGT
jgi:hypothetical protein